MLGRDAFRMELHAVYGQPAVCQAHHQTVVGLRGDGKFLRHTEVCPSVRPGLLLRSQGDSLTIHDPESLDCHSLNRSAAEILQLADGTRNIASIAHEYRGRFQLDDETARNDVLVTLEDLLDKKVLITRHRGADAAKPPD